MDQRRHPTHRGKRPSEQVDVEHKLKDVSKVEVSRSHPVPPDIDRQNGAEPHEQHNQWHEHGFDFHQVEHPHFVAVRFQVKAFCRSAFTVKTLQNPHARDVLLDEARDGALGLLLGVALLVDAGGDEVNAGRHQGEGKKGESGQHRVDVQHDPHHQRDQNGQVQRIHDGRAEVHANVADVFADAVHQVARIVRFVKRRVQRLVVVVDGAFQVKLHQAAHHDDGLTRQEGEHPFDEVGQKKKPRLHQSNPHHKVQDVLTRSRRKGGSGVGSKDGGEHLQVVWHAHLSLGEFVDVHALLQRDQEVAVGVVQGVHAFADHRRRPHGEDVGQDDKDDPEEQPPSVVPNHRIE